MYPGRTEEDGLIPEVVQKLGEGTSPSAVQTSHLAGRSAAEIADAASAWAALAPDRRRAVVALAALGAFSDHPVADLIARGYRDSSDRMRASAVYAMGRTANDRWLPDVLRELESDDPEMRFEAARSAGSLESPRAVVPLITILDDPDSEVRLAAIGALGEIGGDVARKALEQCARGKDPAMREAANDALGEVDPVR